MLTRRNTFKSGSVLKVLISGKLDARVKRASLKFIKWMKYQHAWQRNLSIYIFDQGRIRALDGDLVCGTFFAPDDRDEMAYIRIAGKVRFGADAVANRDALCDHLSVIAHEIGHYLHWCAGDDLPDEEEEEAVSAFAYETVGYFLNEHCGLFRELSGGKS